MCSEGWGSRKIVRLSLAPTRGEGTTVCDPQGNNIGSIKRLMIEKISGHVAYAVMSFGSFLGMGTEEHAPSRRPSLFARSRL
jgi:hypothetical protein